MAQYLLAGALEVPRTSHNRRCREPGPPAGAGPGGVAHDELQRDGLPCSRTPLLERNATGPYLDTAATAGSSESASACYETSCCGMWISPARLAAITACTRVWTPRFAIRCAMWLRTVVLLRKSSSAICSVDLPSARSWSTSIWRLASGSSVVAGG